MRTSETIVEIEHSHAVVARLEYEALSSSDVKPAASHIDGCFQCKICMLTGTYSYRNINILIGGNTQYTRNTPSSPVKI